MKSFGNPVKRKIKENKWDYKAVQNIKKMCANSKISIRFSDSGRDV